MAALPVFAERGFRGTTTRDLAGAARVSEALLYRHFPSKEELYSHIQEEICQSNNGLGDYMSELEPGTSAVVKYLFIIFRIVASLQSDHSLGSSVHRMMIQSLLEDGKFTRSFHEPRFNKILPLMEEALRVSQQKGDLVPGPLTHKERQWFPHHVAVALRLAHFPEEPVFDYGADTARLLQDALWFSLRGIGLTDAAIEKHLDIGSLDEEIRPVLIEAGLLNASAPPL